MNIHDQEYCDPMNICDQLIFSIFAEGSEGGK